MFTPRSEFAAQLLRGMLDAEMCRIVMSGFAKFIFPLMNHHVSTKSTSGLTNHASHHRPHTWPLTPSQHNRISPHSAALAPHTGTASDLDTWRLTPQTSQWNESTIQSWCFAQLRSACWCFLFSLWMHNRQVVCIPYEKKQEQQSDDQSDPGNSDQEPPQAATNRRCARCGDNNNLEMMLLTDPWVDAPAKTRTYCRHCLYSA